MWELSRSKYKRSRYAAEARHTQPQAKRPRKQMQLKRIQPKLVASHNWGLAATLVPSRMVLNDLGPLSVTLSTAMPLELGQDVSLMIQFPREFVVRGKVTYCRLAELESRIFCKVRYPYRVQIEFDFLNDGEAYAVREFVEEIIREHLTKIA